MTSLDLALIGNGAISALVNSLGDIVWMCFPRFDSDPVFCSLLRERAGPESFGFYSMELVDGAKAEQTYLANTAILITRLYDRHGGGVEITDFAPRFYEFDRLICPTMLIRQIKPIGGRPRVTVRLRPATGYGKDPAQVVYSGNHVLYRGSDAVLRLTTHASVAAILEETPFFLEESVTLLLGADESVSGAVYDVGLRYFEETVRYWRKWTRYLSVPFEWQEAVIRSAITLKLNAFEDTGAIIASMTTSIPEAPHSGRNWDYRYCWFRDAYFVINALNTLDVTRTMERYIHYIVNIAASEENEPLQPVYGISGHSVLQEREVASLPGYRGMGPVRIGNQAYRQIQNDVYGSAILAGTRLFFDRRLINRGDETLFQSFEMLGERAALAFDQADAGIWEFRAKKRVHTFSSVMCWAACDRLAKIALHLGFSSRAAYWREQADRIHRVVYERSWNEKRGSFTATMEGNTLDASLLLLSDLGFLDARDPRFALTVQAIEREMRQGDFIFRYVEDDDFGKPENAFLVCTFWYIDALAALDRRDEARALFERVLACRNRHGLLAEQIDPRTLEQWGNFPQTFSMVGLISAARRLSISWDAAL